MDDLLDFINSLVEEGANILRTEKVSREEEIEWLSNVFKRLEKGEIFCVAAEVEGRLVANSEIIRGTGYSRHLGFIGIAVKRGFRSIGIRTEIMKTLEEYAKENGLEGFGVVSFCEQSARHKPLQEDGGFVETGRIPKRFFKDGAYIDEIIMAKVLE